MDSAADLVLGLKYRGSQNNLYQDKKNLHKHFNIKFIETSQDEYKWPFASTVTRGAHSGGHRPPGIYVYSELLSKSRLLPQHLVMLRSWG